MTSSKEECQDKKISGDQSSGLHEKPQDGSFPGWKNAVPILVAIFIPFFLVALDRTIIGTATPKITDEFGSLGDIGWYGSAYLFTSCAFQLIVGRFYTFYSPKYVFLGSVLLFEIGSAICGATPTSEGFIWGRAIAGLGSAGIFSGAITLTLYIIPLQNQPIFVATLGSMFGIASIVAPLLGGALTKRASWRWCFFINLPCGAVTATLILWLLRLPARKEKKVSTKDKIKRLDPLGTLVFVPGIVCLLLALQWGGSTYAWNNGRIVGLLILAGILILSFIAIQIWQQENATVPPRIVKQRTVASATLFSLCVGSIIVQVTYFLPLWFQAIKGADAEKSGIMNLPMVLSLVVASFVGGGLIRKLRYYTPFFIATSCIVALGAGLLTTFKANTGHDKWIGYQVIVGFGMGIGMQQSATAIRNVLPKEDVPIGMSLVFFTQSLGGTVFMSVAQNIFATSVVNGLSKIPGLGLDPDMIVNTGATELRNYVSPKNFDSVFSEYNEAIVNTYYVLLATALFSLVGALGVEWLPIKEEGKKSSQSEA